MVWAATDGFAGAAKKSFPDGGRLIFLEAALPDVLAGQCPRIHSRTPSYLWNKTRSEAAESEE